jgi:hypothetical protein
MRYIMIAGAAVKTNEREQRDYSEDTYVRRGLTAPGPRVSRWRARVAAN